MTTISELEDDRRCWRLVNGVLVEKAKKDMVPDLEVNISNMAAACAELNKGAERCKEEMAKIEEQ